MLLFFRRANPTGICVGIGAELHRTVPEHKPAMTFIGFSTTIRPEEGYQKCPEFWDREYARKYARLWQEWYPTEGQKIVGNGNAMLEVYSTGDMQSPDYECGIWVPICGRVMIS